MSAFNTLMPAHAAFGDHLLALRDMIEEGDLRAVEIIAEDLCHQARLRRIAAGSAEDGRILSPTSHLPSPIS